MTFEFYFAIALSFIMLFTATGSVLAKDLLSSAIISGVTSLCSVLMYIILKSPDVAITEVAVGSSIGFVINILSLIILEKKIEYSEQRDRAKIKKIISLLATIFLFLCLSYIFINLSIFETIENPSNNLTANFYLHNTIKDYGIENTVTAILGGYRGLDTMFETTVILAASFGVYSIINKSDSQ